MRSVFITGIRGFIGSELEAELLENGWVVRGSASEDSNVSRAAKEPLAKLRLGDRCDPELFAKTNAIVHCAYDLRPGRFEANIEGTKRIAEAGWRAGVGNQIFVSSVSAHAGAVTEYGRSKYILEQFFRDRGACVVRLGLVIGPGGIFQRMVELIHRLPAIPLIAGGTAPVSFVAVADVRTAIRRLLESTADETLNLVHPDASNLRSINLEVMRARGLWRLQIPIPTAATILAIRAASALGLRTSITVENVRAMRANARQIPQSDLSRFVTAPRDLRASIRDATP